MMLIKQAFLAELGQYLKSKDINSYLVGGGVRDLLLKQQTEIKDLDVMLEADAIEVLSNLFRNQDFSYQCSKPVLFKKYKTAKIKFKLPNTEIEVDFSSARKEVYPEIASNPICTAAKINEDLARRDFSINAIALSLLDLNTPIDLFDGIADLAAGKIKILHALSFRDDPIRLLRAVRFKVRFGFELEKQSEDLFNQALEKSYASYLPELRVYQELKKALNEELWFEILRELKASSLLLQFSELLDQACKSIEFKDQQADSLAEKLNLLTANLTDERTKELKNKFGIKDVL